jgi:hypothetical protein
MLKRYRIDTMNSYHGMLKTFIFLITLINTGLDFRCHAENMNILIYVAIC